MRKLVLGSSVLYLFLLIFALPVYAAEVAVCHIPPGNPNRARTIYIPERDVADHERHGDEVFESDVCFEGQGECMSEGKQLCTPDGILCDAVPGDPLEESEVSCEDDLDNDCDGLTDSDDDDCEESCTPVGGPCTLANFVEVCCPHPDGSKGCRFPTGDANDGLCF